MADVTSRLYFHLIYMPMVVYEHFGIFGFLFLLVLVSPLGAIVGSLFVWFVTRNRANRLLVYLYWYRWIWGAGFLLNGIIQALDYKSALGAMVVLTFSAAAAYPMMRRWV